LFAIIVIFLTYKSMKKEKKVWISTSLLWLLFTFLGINSMTFHLPIGLFAFRFWMLFAVPVSIIAAEGFWFLVRFLNQLKVPKLATILFFILLIFLTSGKQKYDVNTAIWGPGQMWTSMDEVMGYTWLSSLPPDTKVFAYSNDEQVIGFDKFSCMWCDDTISFRKNLLYRNVSEVYNWRKREGYQYLLFDGMAYRNFAGKYGENESKVLLDKRLEEIMSSDNLVVVHQTAGMVVFKLG
jgi:hypothetical protein